MADPTTGAKGDLRMPVGDIVDGERVLNAAALRAARSRLGQGFPEDVPDAVREKGNEVAGRLLDKFRDRSDRHNDCPKEPRASVAVRIPVPPEVAALFPRKHGVAPHVTLVHVPCATKSQANQILGLVAAWHESVIGEGVTLGDLAYFDRLHDRVAYVEANVSPAMARAQADLAEAIEALDIEISRPAPEWVPHATIGYLDDCAEYKGVTPSGTWTIDVVEIWTNDRRHVVGDCERADRLGRRGAKWLALSEDGDKVLGEYDTEDEARERLRQVEAAKAAKADQRSDEDRAEIRERWQGTHGPNMSPSEMETWLESRFAGPNRKSGDERARARRVAERALRLIEKPLGDWDESDYSGAVQVLAFIERMRAVDQGEPLTVDGREGPSARDASLKDWGFDPGKARSDSMTAREIAVEAAQQALFRWAERQHQDRARRAPAVHTESRNTYEAVRVDRAELRAPTKLANGWRRYPILYSRADIVQEYPDGLEYRDPRDVFDRTSMDSGIGVPWELRHSRDLLNPDTVTGVAMGCVLSVDAHEDGLHTCGEAMAWGRPLFDAIDDETAREVSVAYRCKIDPRPGTTPDGRRFDRRQMAITWNSLAAEPKGRAGSARVLGDRFDASAAINSADAMLAIARAGRSPSTPVYFNRSHWARFDSAHQPKDPKQDADPMMKALIEALMREAGLEMATVAEGLGLSPDDVAALLAGDVEMTPEQADMLAMLIVKSLKPSEEAMADMDRMSMLEKTAKDAADEASRLRGKLVDAEREADKQAALAAQRQDALANMVSRADAEQLATERAQSMGHAIALARRAHGWDFAPEVRKDAEGNESQPGLIEWQRAAIAGAYGERGDEVLARIDAASPEAQPHLIADRLIDAAELLNDRADHSTAVYAAINKTREKNDKTRKDGQTDVTAMIADRKARQQKLASGQPLTNGAA